MNAEIKFYVITRAVLIFALIIVLSALLTFMGQKFSTGQEDKFVSNIFFMVLPFAALHAVRNVDKNVIYTIGQIKMQRINYRLWLILFAFIIFGFVGKVWVLYVIAPVLSIAYYSYNDYKFNFLKRK